MPQMRYAAPDWENSNHNICKIYCSEQAIVHNKSANLELNEQPKEKSINLRCEIIPDNQMNFD
jgi:hypothetical protein